MASRRGPEMNSTKTTTPSTSSSNGTGASAPGDGKPSIWSRLVPSRVTRTQSGVSAATPRSPWWRILVGMFIFIVAAQVFEFVLLFIDSRTNRALEQAAFPKGIPLLGGMSWFVFIYLLFILALYVALLRLNILPRGRDLRREQAARTASTPAGSSRAARRRAARGTTAATAASARRTGTARGDQASDDDHESRPHDAVYERVKAAQRQRRRREARR
jgi:hypothetical protein